MTKKKNTNKNSSNVLPNLFLIKKIDKFYLISEDMIGTLSIDEAFYLWNLARKQRDIQIITDALTSEHVIDNIKVSEGLIRTMGKLEEIYPGLSSRFKVLNQIKNEQN